MSVELEDTIDRFSTFLISMRKESLESYASAYPEAMDDKRTAEIETYSEDAEWEMDAIVNQLGRELMDDSLGPDGLRRLSPDYKNALLQTMLVASQDNSANVNVSNDSVKKLASMAENALQGQPASVLEEIDFMSLFIASNKFVQNYMDEHDSDMEVLKMRTALMDPISKAAQAIQGTEMDAKATPIITDKPTLGD